MMKNLAIASLITLFAAFGAQAQDITKPAKCIDPQTQEEQNACAQIQYDKAENQLNRLYKQVSSLIADPTAKKSLAAAQKSFDGMLDKHCAVYQEFYKNSSMLPLVTYNCKIDLTNNRIRELQSLLEEVKKKSEAEEKEKKK